MFAHLKQDIKTKLSNAPGFQGVELPAVEFAPAPEHTGADISCNWAMAAAKTLHKNPMEIAKQAAVLLREVNGIADATAAAPGFINLKLEDSFITVAALDRRIKRDSYPYGSKQKILIEFVSANPTGPLHMASGRGAALGDSLVRIYRALGYSCDSEYYVNDAGNQAQMLAQSLKARIEGKEPPENGYHGSYLIDMAKIAPKDLKEEDYGRWAMEYLIKTQQDDMVPRIGITSGRSRTKCT